MKELLARIEQFRGEAGSILRNKLIYPKTVVGISRDRPLTEQEGDQAVDCIDQCILLIEAKFVEFIDEFERT